MYRFAVLLVVLSCALSGYAQTYTFSGTATDGSSITGSVTLNGTSFSNINIITGAAGSFPGADFIAQIDATPCNGAPYAFSTSSTGIPLLCLNATFSNGSTTAFTSEECLTNLCNTTRNGTGSAFVQTTSGTPITSGPMMTTAMMTSSPAATTMSMTSSPTVTASVTSSPVATTAPVTSVSVSSGAITSASTSGAIMTSGSTTGMVMTSGSTSGMAMTSGMVMTSGVAPVVATSGSTPAVTSGPVPVVATSGPRPVVATSGVAPVVATSGVAPVIATSGVAPVIATSGVRMTTGNATVTTGGRATTGAAAVATTASGEKATICAVLFAVLAVFVM